jgi:hypothetical protein
VARFSRSTALYCFPLHSPSIGYNLSRHRFIYLSVLHVPQVVATSTYSSMVPLRYLIQIRAVQLRRPPCIGITNVRLIRGNLSRGVIYLYLYGYLPGNIDGRTLLPSFTTDITSPSDLRECNTPEATPGEYATDKGVFGMKSGQGASIQNSKPWLFHIIIITSTMAVINILGENTSRSYCIFGRSCTSLRTIEGIGYSCGIDPRRVEPHLVSALLS